MADAKFKVMRVSRKEDAELERHLNDGWDIERLAVLPSDANTSGQVFVVLIKPNK